jgi:hypothetical protein
LGRAIRRGISQHRLANYSAVVSFFVENGMVVTNTSTRTVHGTGSDGSTFKIHVTVHTNIPPTGTSNEFFRCH